DGGILVNSSIATVEQTVVRDAQADLTNGFGGSGIIAQEYDAKKPHATLLVRNSLVARNTSDGVRGFGADVTLESVRIVDTRPNGSLRERGVGVWVGDGALTVRRSLVEGSSSQGIGVFGSPATIVESVVRDTKAQL